MYVPWVLRNNFVLANLSKQISITEMLSLTLSKNFRYIFRIYLYAIIAFQDFTSPYNRINSNIARSSNHQNWWCTYKWFFLNSFLCTTRIASFSSHKQAIFYRLRISHIRLTYVYLMNRNQHPIYAEYNLPPLVSMWLFFVKNSHLSVIDFG